MRTAPARLLLATSRFFPGLALTGAIAGTALALREIPYIGLASPMILAIGIGIATQNTSGAPAAAKAGISFSMRSILRFAIILLGLQLTAAQLLEVGGIGFAVIAATLLATFIFTTWLGRAMGIDRRRVELIAAGISICGASAVIATNTVTRAPDEDVAYAAACVTIFGSIAIQFVYPLLGSVLQLDPHHFGLWAGASIHEIAQVVAAAFQQSRDAGEFGTVAKLARVMMLAPVAIALDLLATRRARAIGAESGSAKVPMPWFAFGFVAMVIPNSLVDVPHEGYERDHSDHDLPADHDAGRHGGWKPISRSCAPRACACCCWRCSLPVHCRLQPHAGETDYMMEMP